MASLAVALWDSGVAEWSLTCCIGLFNHWPLIISTLFTFFFESSYVFFFHHWSQQPIPTPVSHTISSCTLSLLTLALMLSLCHPPTSSLTCTHHLLPTISHMCHHPHATSCVHG